MNLTDFGKEELDSLVDIYGKQRGRKLFKEELDRMTKTKRKRYERI